MNAAQIIVIGTGAILLCCASPSRLAAQDDPVPKEPLLPRAPDMSAWTVTYRYKPVDVGPKQDPDAKQKPPDQVVSVQVQKTGKIYHRVVTWASGIRTDAWNVGQREVAKGKTGTTYVLMPNEGPATDDYSKSDFEDISWINMKSYAGFKKGDQPVFIFQAKNSERPLTRRERYSLVLLNLPHSTPADDKKGSAASPGATPSKADTKTSLAEIFGESTATVVLDAKTQLPVAYDDGKTIWAYQFTTPPTDTLVPPPEVTKILRQFDDYTKRTAVRPSAP